MTKFERNLEALGFVRDDENSKYSLQTATKLISIAEEPITNENGTEIYPCVVELSSGEKRRAFMNATNFDYGVETGETYLTTVNIIDGERQNQPFVTVSHLVSAANPSLLDFGIDMEPAASKAKKKDPVEAGEAVA